MNIIRITRHSATAPQIADLLRIFGDDCVITEMDEQFPADQREAVARFDVLAAEYSGPRNLYNELTRVR